MAISTKKPIQDIDYDAFRDTIGTVDDTGKRRWVYPKKPAGRFHNWRAIVSVILLTLLFSGPLLRWNGNPMFLFNFLERKFILFGITFWPQDFHLFVLAMLSFMVFIVLFTVVFGRVWCGWACPQTVFMEMVFRKIEYWIEGDRNKQIKLNEGPWTAEKIGKKTLKFSIFLVFSFLIANTLLAYIVGVDAMKGIVTQDPSENWSLFAGALAFTGIFFFVFAYFREQACIAVCPYGRLQGVMLDKNSIVVAYDFVRGEPRERLKKGEERSSGDCVSCNLCVHVCPTGIDIRNGTQMECVNCTACIDACDEVMDKVGFEPGLIRYDSYNGIVNRQKLRFTGRMAAYTGVLALLLGLFVFLLVTRSDIEITLLRTPGVMFQTTEAGKISNLYNIQVVNKTTQAYENVRFKIVKPEGATVRLVGKDFTVPGQEIHKGTLFIDIPKENLTGRTTKILLEAYEGEKKLDEAKTAFVGPIR